MFKIIRDLFSVLSKKEILTIYKLQLIFIFGALLEILSVFSIIPYLYVLSSNSPIDELLSQYKLDFLLNYGLFNYDLKIVFGFFLFFFLSISNLIQFISNLFIVKFSNQLGKNFQLNLFDKYINLNFLEYINTQHSELKQNIIQEGSRIVPGVIMPLLQINSKIFNTFVILLLLFSQFSFEVFFIIFFIVLYYFLIFKIFKSKSSHMGILISNTARKYLRYMDFAFSNFMITKINFLENYFFYKVQTYISEHIKAVNFIQIISVLPRYLIETITFGGIIILSIYLYSTNTADLISKLGFLAFAAYRIVPSFNMIYNNLVILNSNKIALLIYKDSMNKKSSINIKPKKFNKINSIEVKNLSYAYGSLQIIKNLNFKVNKGQIVGIRGKSGIGKSTLFRLLMGVDRNYKGNIFFNDNLKDKPLFKLTQIGLVGQDPRIFDDDFIYNIVSNSNINHNQIIELLKLLDLEKFKNESIYSIRINEDGSNLSGGQNKRLMLAHALYKNPQVLFLDETFTSLDKKLENDILLRLKKFNPELIIFIISHNEQTLKKCNLVISLNE